MVYYLDANPNEAAKQISDNYIEQFLADYEEILDELGITKHKQVEHLQLFRIKWLCTHVLVLLLEHNKKLGYEWYRAHELREALQHTNDNRYLSYWQDKEAISDFHEYLTQERLYENRLFYINLGEHDYKQDPWWFTQAEHLDMYPDLFELLTLPKPKKDISYKTYLLSLQK